MIEAHEQQVADFLDEALERLLRGEGEGETPLPAALLGADATPDLVEISSRLLADVRQLFELAQGVRSHAQWLRSDLAELTQEPVPAQPGAEVPDPFPREFRFVRLLGQGAFGTVWLAEDLHLGRQVALKMLPAANPRAEAALVQLRQEARLLAALAHPHIVQVHAWRESTLERTGEVQCLVLQYVPGGSLAERVKREGPMPWALAARYVCDVAEGLQQVHARGIIHRDIKPANLLWNSVTDEALLTDFGISARLATATGRAGTPLYMAPEAFAGHISFAQDVYSLAASLFWLTTGMAPFPGGSSAEIERLSSRGLPDPDTRCAGLPVALEQLLRRGLAAQPHDRPTLLEFTAALRGVLNQTLADDLARPAETAPVRLIVSRQLDAHTFVPVAASQARQPRLLRDLKRVPPDPPRLELFTGERVRLEVVVETPGYLIVFNVGPSGNLNLLYPEDTTAASVNVDQPLHVLNAELTPPAGRERVFALWTRDLLPLRLDELQSLAQNGVLPGSATSSATRDLVKLKQTVQQLAPEDWSVTVVELDHRPHPI